MKLFGLLELFNLIVEEVVPLNLYCDNKVTIQIATNPIFYEKQNILKLIVMLLEITWPR